MGDVNIDAVFESLLDVEGQWRDGEHDADEIVTLWIGLTHAQRVLDDLVKTVADDASSRLLDRDDPRADHETALGDVVHLAPGYAPERWQGRALVQALAEPVRVLDANGEIIEADIVPVDVLLDVLPGCADYDSTSSKWRTTGLRRVLGDDWRRYRHRDTAPLVIKRGPRPTKP